MIDLFQAASAVEDLCHRQGAFADRLRDWDDIEGIVSRQKGLDWDTIESELQPLVENKESPEILDRLRQIRSIVS